jgi:hypothetical protein
LGTAKWAFAHPRLQVPGRCGPATDEDTPAGRIFRVSDGSGDTGAGGPRVDRSAWTISIYGTISVAVVVAEYASSSAGRLALLILGYGVSLWIAHGYAGVVSATFATWSSSLRHAWPVAESALPALAVVGLAALLGWPTRIAVPLALVACLANLVAVQIAVLRRGGPRSAGRIAATIGLDIVAGAVVLAVLTLLR